MKVPAPMKTKIELLDVMKKLTLKAGYDFRQKSFKSVEVDIDDVPTEVIIIEYIDKTLLVVSQYQKTGSLLMLHRVNIPLGLDNTYTIRVIFGDARKEQRASARYFADVMNNTKPLCIFINLKSYDVETVNICKDLIFDLKQQENK